MRVQDSDGTPLIPEDLVLEFYLLNDLPVELVMLRHLDRYDDTIFTGLQIKQVLIEWDTLLSLQENEKDLEACNAVRKYLEYCTEGSFRYVKFIGD